MNLEANFATFIGEQQQLNQFKKYYQQQLKGIKDQELESAFQFLRNTFRTKRDFDQNKHLIRNLITAQLQAEGQRGDYDAGRPYFRFVFDVAKDHANDIWPAVIDLTE